MTTSAGIPAGIPAGISIGISAGISIGIAATIGVGAGNFLMVLGGGFFSVFHQKGVGCRPILNRHGQLVVKRVIGPCAVTLACAVLERE